MLASGVIYGVYRAIRATDVAGCQQCSDSPTTRAREPVASRHLALARGRVRGKERRNDEMKGKEKRREEKKKKRERRDGRGEGSETSAPARECVRAREHMCVNARGVHFLRQL